MDSIKFFLPQKKRYISKGKTYCQKLMMQKWTPPLETTISFLGSLKWIFSTFQRKDCRMGLLVVYLLSFPTLPIGCNYFKTSIKLSRFKFIKNGYRNKKMFILLSAPLPNQLTINWAFISVFCSTEPWYLSSRGCQYNWVDKMYTRNNGGGCPTQ